MDKSEKNGNVDNNVSVFTFRPYVGQSVHVGIFFFGYFSEGEGFMSVPCGFQCHIYNNKLKMAREQV